MEWRGDTEKAHWAGKLEQAVKDVAKQTRLGRERLRSTLGSACAVVRERELIEQRMGRKEGGEHSSRNMQGQPGGHGCSVYGRRVSQSPGCSLRNRAGMEVTQHPWHQQEVRP